jgi:adenine phosphoribosyltransferase
MSPDDLSAALRDRFRLVDGDSDVWPWFYEQALLGRVVTALAAPLAGTVTKVAGIEARGFMLGAAVAVRLEAGFVAIRKAGGLYPGETLVADTDVDYRGRRQRLRSSAPRAARCHALLDAAEIV